MGGGGPVRGDVHAEDTPPAAALLRRPALFIRHQVLVDLREAGFTGILPAHLGVFQHPGPDGQRPGVLAARNLTSKQAMNHLLHQLESAGYLVREDHPDNRRTRVVRLTDRGWAVARTIEGTVRAIEATWAELLGPDTYAELRHAIASLHRALDVVESD
jgi:DNA-binding MarR family transcriptional regulator